VRRAERATWESVDWIGERAAAENINCGFAKGGILSVARNEAQEERIRAHVDHDRQWGWGEQDVMALSREQVLERVQIPDARMGSFTPHGARVNPAALARGLADAVERKGGVIYEQTAAEFIEPGRVVTEHGTIKADHVIRATEAFTVQFANQSRAYLPLYSLMIATEPLPESVWDELGIEHGHTFSDGRHLVIYGQRTADNRFAFGGRGARYHWGSAIKPEYDRVESVFLHLTRTLREMFPQIADRIVVTHRWGGPLGVPRDWHASVSYDPATGLGGAGGYVGDGLTTTNLAGRTLADLITGAETPLTALPWVNHRSPAWEPEPLRFLGANAGLVGTTLADEEEKITGRPSIVARLLAPLTGH
jgi:glycine/D-amino acid oxidase-like deaminating enzyme